MMNWLQLLKPYRYKQTLQDGATSRTEFERDFDRVVFSEPFRKLQDKTQVIPLPENDFVHNRLTHSLETSSVGRSLGRKVAEALLLKYPELNTALSSYDIGCIVAAACLAHDIGNPPFGHSGEDAIREYFLNGQGAALKQAIADDKKWEDLINFEGNANGFKVVTNSSGNDKGLRLTYPTLAAFSKYPKESLPVYTDKQVHEKKFGFFQSEASYFQDVATKLGLLNTRNDGHLNWCRHPLAFLVEAADDICYSIIDFEDGLNLKWIDFAHAKELLIPFVENYKADKFEQMTFEGQVGFLRASAIDYLTNELAQIFMQNEEAILNGTFNQSLIKLSSKSHLIDKIKAITREKVYKNRIVIEIEAAGFEVISGLLHICISAVNQHYKAQQDKTLKYYRSQKVIELIPEQFIGKNKIPSHDLYERIMKIGEFISGMTDNAAIGFYRKLKGIQLG
ncbi:MAG: deoxyguanosinetriphosphate triphosphohydrolase [Bacteroidota bacterium]